MNISKGLVISLVVFLLLVVLNAVLAYRNVRAVREHSARVQRTSEVLASLETLISTIKDAETGQRGFLLVGEKPYLDPYEKAVDSIPGQMLHIKAMTRNNPEQQARIASLETKIDEKLKELEKTVALRKADHKTPQQIADDAKAATAIVKQDTGRKIMEDIRSNVDEMERVEEKSLLDRNREANESYQWAVSSGSLAAVLSILLIAGVFFLMQRYITARAEAAAKLYEEGERFRTTLASIGDAVIVTDTQGRLTFLNSVAECLTGWPSAEAVGQPLTTVFNIVNEETRVLVESPVAKVLRSGLVEGLANHTVLIARDGREFPIDDSGAPVRDADGKVRGVVLVFRDFTERKKVEEALIEAKVAAEAANVSKSRFLANMSHELRTPMNAILGMIDVALPKADSPTVLDCLRTAKGSADLLLTLLNDLLDSAKIESGKLEIESAPFSLRRMMDQMARVLAMRASEKGLCFYCRMPEETPDVVRGDRTRLQQVLLNLAGNAIKFTEHGEVEVGLHALVQDGDSSVTFIVRDTGIGIAPAAQERLFQRFAQADATMARRFGGTGLGLAICKNLVELMGGRISVQSEVGKGSTFHFTVRLPLTDETPLDYESPSFFATTAAAQLRVLLAEDNPANQKLARYILEDRGHLVEVAADGQEAFRMSGQDHYDVILMDVQMPKMNGLETTAAIRKHENGNQRVPIIAMTAHAMQGDRGNCLAAGMDGYLAKPVSAHELVGLVESLGGSGRPPAAETPSPANEPTGEPSPIAPGVFNIQEALSHCAESSDVLQQMIQYFFDDVHTMLPQIRADLDEGNVSEIGRQAHRMNGTLVYLSANAAMHAARHLEHLCDASEGHVTEEIAEAVGSLEKECASLKEALLEYQATTAQVT